MGEPKPTDERRKAKYAYLENLGCLLFFMIGGICFASMQIMELAFGSSHPMAGAAAVAALAAMGVGVTALLVGARDE